MDFDLDLLEDPVPPPRVYSKYFHRDYTIEEQTNICKQIAIALMENNIDAKVTMYKEEVCQLTEPEIRSNTILKCKKILRGND